MKPSGKRGRDIPNSLTHLADKHANDLAEEMNVDATFSEVEKHQLRHREVNYGPTYRTRPKMIIFSSSDRVKLKQSTPP